MDNLLTQIETPGTVIIPHGYENRRALALHIYALIAAGHAVTVDETYEYSPMRPDRDTRGELRVYHAKTCVKCKKTVL